MDIILYKIIISFIQSRDVEVFYSKIKKFIRYFSQEIPHSYKKAFPKIF